MLSDPMKRLTGFPLGQLRNLIRTHEGQGFLRTLEIDPDTAASVVAIAETNAKKEAQLQGDPRDGESAGPAQADKPDASKVQKVAGKKTSLAAQQRFHMVKASTAAVDPKAQSDADRDYWRGRKSPLPNYYDVERGLRIGLEKGAIPSGVRTTLESRYKARSFGGPVRHYRMMQTLLKIKRKHPAAFAALSPYLRMAVNLHGHLEAKRGALDPNDRTEQNTTALKRRYAAITGAVDTIRWDAQLKTMGAIADWLPVIGETKSGVETIIAIINLGKAQARGDKAAVAKHRTEIAWGLVGAIPALSYTKKGRKAAKLLFAPVSKLSSAAGKAYRKALADASKRLAKGGPPQAEKASLLDKTKARMDLARFDKHGRQNDLIAVKIEDVFRSDWNKLSGPERARLTLLFDKAKGSAGENTIGNTMRSAGADVTDKGSGRAVRPEGRPTRIYDLATKEKLTSVFGLFLFPTKYKGKLRHNKITVIEVKTDGAQPSKIQSKTGEIVKKHANSSDPVETLKANSLVADVRLFRLPLHKIERSELFPAMREQLSRKFPPDQVNRMMKDLDTFYRTSKDRNPITLGSIMLFMAAGKTLKEGQD